MAQGKSSILSKLLGRSGKDLRWREEEIEAVEWVTEMPESGRISIPPQVIKLFHLDERSNGQPVYIKMRLSRIKWSGTRETLQNAIDKGELP